MINEEAKEIKEEIEAQAIEVTESATDPKAEDVSIIEVAETSEPIETISEVLPEPILVSTILETSEEPETIENQLIDYSNFQKSDFVNTLEKVLADVKENPSIGIFRKSEDTLKEIRPLFEQIKSAEKNEALAKFKESNDGSEDGFEFKPDTLSEQFDKLFKAIKEERSKYFANIEKEKDKNFSQKTVLINRLRTLVEGEDSNDPAHIKSGFNEFKKIQEEWKSAGNVNSPHNNTLWQTFHALVDRFYSNRSIYFELLELDRKRNLQHKIELCSKIEKIAETSKTENVTGKMLDEAVATFEEYKHIGPAPKEENELIWQRVKDALDIIYGKRREQLEASKAEAEQVFGLKSSIAELIQPFASFNSASITEWNDRTKALLALQDQWNNIKGFMPKEKGKELSDKFWSDIKTFFRNKTEFFRLLEIKREENLKAKNAIIEEVEALLANEDESQEAANTVIRLQKEFREIGHVPEKDKDIIYTKFKTVCDAFFNAKRAKNQSIEKEFEANLVKKTALCEQIEKEAVEGADTARLAEFKSQWASIGFVPKKEMQNIGKRYINAINKYVSAMAKLSGREREQLSLQNEVEMVKSHGESPKDLIRKENDIRRKMQTIENDIAVYRNNLEFFAKSKNADKLRQDVEAKIQKASKELSDLKHQIKIIREAEK